MPEVIGFPFGLNEINQRAGQLVVGLRDNFADIVIFNAKLVSLADAYFTGTVPTGLGMSSTGLTLLRNSFIDLSNLSKVAHGTAQQVGNNDFFFNANNLTGAV